MALFAIGDLHLALGCDKPMDIFPGWEGYLARMEQSWRASVADGDTVVLAGDTSWAMRLDSCLEDFAFINGLPGRKLILKGNHDYWWNTCAKMKAFFEKYGLNTFTILHNNAFLAEGVTLCGTRGWLNEPGQPQDAKVMKREAGRLEMSLRAAHALDGEAEKLVFLHYPPVFPGSQNGDIVALLRSHAVRRCFYGHLHGSSIRHAVQETRQGVAYRLISADALGFAPLRII